MIEIYLISLLLSLNITRAANSLDLIQFLNLHIAVTDNDLTSHIYKARPADGCRRLPNSFDCEFSTFLMYLLKLPALAVWKLAVLVITKYPNLYFDLLTFWKCSVIQLNHLVISSFTPRQFKCIQGKETSISTINCICHNRIFNIHICVFCYNEYWSTIHHTTKNKMATTVPIDTKFIFICYCAVMK